MSWSDDDRAEVYRLWGAGRSAGEIAARFPSKTRSSILGLLFRAGKLTRGQASKTITAGLQNRRKLIAKAARPNLRTAGGGVVFEEAEAPPPIYVPPASAWEPLADTTPVTFIDRPALGCRWPVDVADAGHWCCGVPTTTDDAPYCWTHTRLGVSQAKKSSAKELARSLRRYAE